MSGLLVLRAGRLLVGNLTLLECLVEEVELWKDKFAMAVVLGACGLRLRVCNCIAASMQPAPNGDVGCAAAV